MRARIIIQAFLSILAAECLCSPVHGQQQRISIGIENANAAYYPIIAAMCRVVSQDKTATGAQCAPQSTAGSIKNLDMLRMGQVKFAMIQSDQQYLAYNGEGVFANAGKFRKLRALLSMQPEPLAIVTRSDPSINNLKALKGKRVGVGAPGSTTFGVWDALGPELGWSYLDTVPAPQLRWPDVGRALCNAEIDSAILSMPGQLRTDTGSSPCPTQFVSPAASTIDAVIAQYPYYRKVAIPAGWHDNPNIVGTTIALGATLVTTEDVPEEDVYKFVKAVLANQNQLRKAHPVFANLDTREMIRDGLSAPLHPGAVRAARELNIITTNYDTLITRGGEVQGYGLYTYVLFPRPTTKVRALIEVLLSQATAVNDTDVNLRKHINLVYVPTAGGVKLKQPADDKYDFDHGEKILFDICRGKVSELQALCDKAWGEGPFLFTYVRPIAPQSELDPPYLFVDLSDWPVSTYPEVIAAYRDQVKRADYTDRERIENYRLVILKFLQIAAGATPSIVKEAKEFLHVIFDKKK